MEEKEEEEEDGKETAEKSDNWCIWWVTGEITGAIFNERKKCKNKTIKKNVRLQ